MTQPIRILIADDHPIVRQGLRALIETEPGMQVVAEAADGNEALEQARRLRPDVILLDLIMPGKDGLEVLGEIVAETPGSRVLILTSFGEQDRVKGAIQAGAAGYLLKDTSPQTLLQAIRDVHTGKTPLDPGITRTLIHGLEPSAAPANPILTPREVEVLTLVAHGLSNQEIAERLVVTEKTVRTHITNILSKLNLENRTQAALYALREGLTDLNST